MKSCSLLTLLQWGRGLSTAESTMRPSVPATAACFNGAAVFQPRKGCNVPVFIASRIRCFNGAAVFQPRKAAARVASSSADCRLQWGRGLSTAERYASKGSSGMSARLQWGRGLSTAESSPASGTGKTGGKASMGPRSFNRGKHPSGICDDRFTAKLQWGRGLSTAERIELPTCQSS